MDDLMDEINNLKEEIIQDQEELQEMLQQSPPPWSTIQKADIKSRNDRLMEKQLLWVEEMEHIKAHVDRLLNNDPTKDDLRQTIRAFKNDLGNRQMLRSVDLLTKRVKNLLLLKCCDDGTTLGPIAAGIFFASKEVRDKPRLKYITTPVPALNIAKFKGDYMEWDGFWQRFKYAVHDRAYPDVEKLYALMNLLDARAKDAVAGIRLCSENYTTVLKILVDRFGRKEMIVANLQMKLRDLQRAKPTPDSIRMVVDSIHNICRQLQNNGVDINNEPTKIDIISKLPIDEQKELYRYKAKKNASTEQLLKKLQEISFCAEVIPHERDEASMFEAPGRIIDEEEESDTQRETIDDASSISSVASIPSIVRGKSKDGAALAVESGTKSGDARKNAGCKSDGATCARRDNGAKSCISAAAVDSNVKCNGTKCGRGVPTEGRGAGSKDYVGATTVMIDVPPGLEQQQQCYLDAPPGFEFAVASTSTLSTTPTEILPDHPRKIFQARVQDDGMSLKLVGGEDLSEKASYSSMPVSRESNVVEGRRKYGIFRRPTIRAAAIASTRGSITRVTAITRTRPCKSTVRGALIVSSRSCAWDTVLYQIDRGPSPYIIFDAFIIIVFDGGGNYSTVIVILDDVLELQYDERDNAKLSNDLCCLRGWWQCRGESAIFFSFSLLLWRYVN